jgi:hypothetical protein
MLDPVRPIISTHHFHPSRYLTYGNRDGLSPRPFLPRLFVLPAQKSLEAGEQRVVAVENIVERGHGNRLRAVIP